MRWRKKGDSSGHDEPRWTKRKLGLGVAILVILFVVGVSGTVYVVYAAADRGVPEGPVSVRIVEGDTLAVAAGRLKRAGAIESVLAFELEARLWGEATRIQPGEYEFRPGVSNRGILARITSGPQSFTVTIPEGLTLEQTARRVAAQSNISAAEFEGAARATNYDYAFLQDPAIENTEGFLFPKQYEFEEGTSARQIVSRMLEQYLIETWNLDFSRATQRPELSEYEVLSVASLIERESARSEERPKVASVIYNRLREGMRLQIDATVQYARGEPKENLTLEDLKVDSPYNTYANAGLPPGPICSPSLDSIKAALEPARTDYLYYVLGAGGERHFFTSSYDEFLEKKAEAGR